jgi:nicotinate-nucleotide adenylyltransferase
VTVSCVAKKVGILGGTFDPIHIGHLRGAIEVAELLGLDELRLIPSARPPHRSTPTVSAQQRLAMVELAVAGVLPLLADGRELQRLQPSYSIDTLESLRRELAPDDQLFLLLGWDAFAGLPSWHRWQQLLNHCHLLVLQRPDVDRLLAPELQALLAAQQVENAAALSGPSGQIALIQQAPLAVSASHIRQLLGSGKSARFLVPDAVLAYIHAHGLYPASN